MKLRAPAHRAFFLQSPLYASREYHELQADADYAGIGDADNAEAGRAMMLIWEEAESADGLLNIGTHFSPLALIYRSATGFVTILPKMQAAYRMRLPASMPS